MRDTRDGRRGFGALLRDLAEGSVKMVRDEVRLAKLELAEVAADAAKGTVFVATGVAFTVLGALALVVGLALLVGDQWLPADLYWLAALILMVITGAAAAWLAKRGLSIVSPSELAPHETVTTLKEDQEWLKQRLTSGATSN
ncbi:MAG TPA: phage holin family protein [Gemmatimonadaceae bacterium]